MIGLQANVLVFLVTVVTSAINHVQMVSLEINVKTVVTAITMLPVIMRMVNVSVNQDGEDDTVTKCVQLVFMVRTVVNHVTVLMMNPVIM